MYWKLYTKSARLEPLLPVQWMEDYLAKKKRAKWKRHADIKEKKGTFDVQEGDGTVAQNHSKKEDKYVEVTHNIYELLVIMVDHFG